MSSGKIRLQKFLAHAGLGSRRSCEEIIAAGRVSVNGSIVSQMGSSVSPESDVIKVDGAVVRQEELKIYLFHKPSNVLTTLSEPDGRTCVGDYVKDLPVRVYPVGRLDYDVVGLVVLSNDGDYANTMLHPRYEVPRIYEARVGGLVGESEIERLCSGVELDDELVSAKWAELITESNAEGISLLGKAREGESYVRVCVAEGSKHFVKRLLEAVGAPVQKLARIQFGPYSLGKLREGEIVEVSFLDLDIVSN